MQKRIKIAVKEPEINHDQTVPYVTYSVIGQDSKGPFAIRRRYRDFNLLREKIVQRWPGLYVPPIASKKLAGNTQDKFVQLRRKFLNYFCDKISEREYFFNSDVFQTFIRGSGEFEKSVKQLQKIDYEALSSVYQKNFTQLTQNSSSAELQLASENDYQFMKASQKQLQRVREELRTLSLYKADYQRQFSQVMGNALPEYQDKFLLKYVEDDRSKLFLSSGDEFAKKLKEYEEYSKDNVLEDYCELISYELREMRAFVEAIDSRRRAQETKQKIESRRRDAKQQVEKLKQGKTTLKSFFSSGSKQDKVKELEHDIQKWEKDEQALGSMIFLMNASICHEISEYKKRRSQQYKGDVIKINRKQLKQLNILGELLQIPLRQD